MEQLELFEEINSTTNRIWNQVDANIKRDIVTRLGRLMIKASQEKANGFKQKEENHDES